VEGAFGGIPFPIPKDGYEAIMNHRLAWRGVNTQMPLRVWVMTADGKRSLASGGTQTIRNVYYDPAVSADKFDGYYTLGKFVASGIGLFDEAFNLFGPIDKHELKLVGKKALYIPYNNRAALAKVADLATPQTLNPNLVRWELHRVWEVEATLAAGKRHVAAKRWTTPS
jgi:hypothetical protein